METARMTNVKVGELNGRWALLLKVCGLMVAVLVPLLSINSTLQSHQLSRLEAGQDNIQATANANSVSISALQEIKVKPGDMLAVWNAIAELQREVAAFPKEVPPKWLVERIDKLEAGQTKLADNLAALVKTVAETRPK